MKHGLLCLILLLFSFSAQAVKVQVYFFKWEEQGHLFTHERGGQFWHVAMKYQDRYLEADTYYGVRLIDSLQGLGDIAAHIIIDVPLTEAELSRRVEAELGKEFALRSAWDDPLTTQCSKLIAKVLGLKPNPLRNGKYTFSPDSLFLKLHEIKGRSLRRCQSLFGG